MNMNHIVYLEVEVELVLLENDDVVVNVDVEVIGGVGVIGGVVNGLCDLLVNYYLYGLKIQKKSKIIRQTIIDFIKN
jgi:hypothetical protein